MSIRAM